jgi:diaminohydroxyphosphoribosylaminopyrimidine deaminase/5-amino-6-(5-phosphoribosylamino)uracil reductase
MHEKYIKLAFSLAKKGVGKTSPNPLVGAVLVKNGKIVGKGYHKKAGEPHAEVNAINEASDLTRDSTLYINLEPCAHTGRTPPCTERIIKAGIKRVVASMVDPNPLVCGRGFETLKKANIEVIEGILEEEARLLNEIYLKYITSKIPFVVLKCAMSLDGKITTSNPLLPVEDRWITGLESRKFAHKLRYEADAILVGVETILKDNPILDTRFYKKDKDIYKIIVDTNCRISFESRILKRPEKVIIATTSFASEDKIKKLKGLGVKIIQTQPDSKGRVDIKYLLKKIGSLGISCLLVEGGAEINATFIDLKLVDKLHFIISPKLLGGRKVLGPIGGEGIDRTSFAPSLKNLKIRRLGDDILITGYLKDV